MVFSYNFHLLIATVYVKFYRFSFLNNEIHSWTVFTSLET